MVRWWVLVHWPGGTTTTTTSIICYHAFMCVGEPDTFVYNLNMHMQHMCVVGVPILVTNT